MRIGVVGGGQLGRMLGLAGLSLGIDFRFWDPSADAPAASVGKLVCGGYDDKDALELFADNLDVITYEFENIPADTLNLLGERGVVRPGCRALEISQDRFIEKTFLAEAGIPTGEWRRVDSVDDLTTAWEDIGPCIVKTRRFGYDGKGQHRILALSDCQEAWENLGKNPLIVEKMVPFDRELSLIGVRSITGEMRTWPLVENIHSNGILYKTVAPAPSLAAGSQDKADKLLRSVMEALDYVGVLAIEFFEVNGELVANEIAPRVHNSGHWTIEGAVTSQFENHIRAVAGLPLGSTALRFPSVMLNLIGFMPSISDLLHTNGLHLHNYGKEARPGRKLGHITLCDELLQNEVQNFRQRVADIDAITGPPEALVPSA